MLRYRTGTAISTVAGQAVRTADCESPLTGQAPRAADCEPPLMTAFLFRALRLSILRGRAGQALRAAGVAQRVSCRSRARRLSCPVRWDRRGELGIRAAPVLSARMA